MLRLSSGRLTRPVWLLALLAALSLSGCELNLTATKLASALPKSSQKMPVAMFQQKLDEINRAAPEVANTPAWFLPQVFYLEKAKDVVVIVTHDSGKHTASLIYDGIPDDDSVAGYRFDVEFKQNEGDAWEFTSVRQSWRCWPGRGHQGYSAEPCV